MGIDECLFPTKPNERGAGHEAGRKDLTTKGIAYENDVQVRDMHKNILCNRRIDLILEMAHRWDIIHICAAHAVDVQKSVACQSSYMYRARSRQWRLRESDYYAHR
jgi:hypothetical protein